VKLNTAIEGEQNRGDKELEKKKRAWEKEIIKNWIENGNEEKGKQI
jgi:hypothetical protein